MDRSSKSGEESVDDNRRFVHPYMNIAMVLLCVSILAQSMIVTGALNICISTIEKLFNYNSFQISFIEILYNFGILLGALSLGCVMVNNKMRWIGAGMLLASFGCMVFISPVLSIKNIENRNVDVSYLCNGDFPTARTECKPLSYIYLAIMCLAYFIIGIGVSPIHTIAINFIQESTTRRQAGFFLGVYFMFSAVGPSILFLVSTFIMKIPLLIHKDTQSMLSHNDENWVGAYWIIYVLGGSLAFLVSLPMIWFPKNPHIISSPAFSGTSFGINRFVSLLRKVGLNYGFILVTLSMFFDAMLGNAIGVFFSMYIEIQFSLETGKAGLYSGVILVLGAALGLFTGGLLIKVYNWNNKQLIKRIAFISFAGVFSLLFLFFHCPENPIKGVIYKNNQLEFESNVADECKCDARNFFPVCFDEKDSYYSPCSLGCETKSLEGTFRIFKNCSKELTSSGTVKQGRCGSRCKYFTIFMILGFVCAAVEFLIYTPLITYTTRELARECRLFGLSMQQIVLRISAMLGPIYQGRFFDMSCIVFSPMINCKKTSKCIDYSHKKFSMSIALPSIILKSLATVFLILIVFLNKSRKNEVQGTQDTES